MPQPTAERLQVLRRDELEPSPAEVAIPMGTATGLPSDAGPLIELTRPSVTGIRHRRSRFHVPRLVRRAVGPIAVLAVWQMVCSAHVFTSQEVASPVQVWDAARQLWDQGALQHNLWVSLRRVLEGLSLGVAVGLVLAVLSGFFHVAEDLLDPVLQGARAIPILGLLPLFIIWFGVGEAPKVYLISLGCLFPVYINTFGAIRGVDAKLVEAGRTFGLGRFGLIGRIILPGSLPGFLVGLRFALIGSWLFVIVAEQINSESGIGYLIAQAQTTDRTDIMFVGLAIYAILGVGADILVRGLERHLLSWRRGFEGG
jgi:sulfonate transport system permease protein